jgi:uncharacterized membrane protein YdjX (TVP38/TMEM64 family)
MIIYVSVKHGAYIMNLANKPEQLQYLLNSYGQKGKFIFILIQTLQVIVAAIPGEILQLGGGYIYGIWLGTIYSITGIFLGSIIVFYLSRFLGYSIVRLFVSQKNAKKLDFMINSNKSEIGMFILFLLPGMPKDVLTYIAGLTPVKPHRFLIFATLGRLPALIASSYIGYNAQRGNYFVVVILLVASVLLFLIGFAFKNIVISKLYNFRRQ